MAPILSWGIQIINCLHKARYLVIGILMKMVSMWYRWWFFNHHCVHRYLDMLMYLDHLQNWLVYSHGLLIFPILVLFWLSKKDQIWVSGHYPENLWRKWPEILHADVSWPPLELISSWLRSVDFSNFGAILTGETGQIWGFRAFSGKLIVELARNFACWCIYPDHLQNWLDYGYSLLICLILMLFWFSEMGQIWGFQAF